MLHPDCRRRRPALLRGARRGASASGLLRRAGFSGSTARGVAREPDSDFSSLPMLPPALPDCARAISGKATMASVADSRAAFTIYRMTFCIINWCPKERVLGRTHRQNSADLRQDLPVSPHSSSAAPFGLWTAAKRGQCCRVGIGALAPGPTIDISCNGGHAEPVIGCAFARPVGLTHPTIPASLTSSPCSSHRTSWSPASPRTCRGCRPALPARRAPSACRRRGRSRA